MKTEDILLKLKETQFQAEHFEQLDWVTQELWDSLEEVHTEDTNPRRDYLGHKVVYKNKTDGKFFYVEDYGNDYGCEIYDFKEVKPVEKTITVYELVPTNPS